jgi:hypothetical protein
MGKNEQQHPFKGKRSDKAPITKTMAPPLKKALVKKKGAKRKDASSSGEDDWLASLARQSSSGGEVNENENNVLSKKERIERRDAKKRRRQDRKDEALSSSSQSVSRNLGQHTAEQGNNARQSNLPTALDEEEIKSTKQSNISAQRLVQLSREIRKSTSEFQTKSNKRSWVKMYEAPDAGIRGKAAAGRTIKGDGSSMQPRKRDYGGLGLARPTLFLSLRDPSFLPLLQQEFAEHVTGFFGKQRTKAMKKQLDGNMLWRQLQKQKSQHGSKTFNGKKLSDMEPDERVEAMIKLGAI